LPGIGAYAQKAIETGNIQAILYASLAMLVVIVLVDQFFWRPVVAWSEKFKLDTMASTEVPTSWVLDLLYAARLPRMFNRWWRKVVSAYRKTPIAHLKLPRVKLRREPERGRVAPSRFNSDVFFGAILGAIFVTAIVMAGNFVSREVSLREIGYTFLLGIVTLLRVMVLVVLAGLVWTPVGVWIGLNPKLARISQPVVQFLSSFPAVLVFPFFTILFIRTGLNMNIGAIILMALGTQWYILFNSIAGAFKIPTTLRDMSSNMGLRGWLLWKRLILPAIFPSWVTGAITASGGAWNASIIAEVTEWNKTKLTASGLGSYIVNAHETHDIARMVLGVTVMCVFVVGINRFFWRRLYALAEEKYLLA
jgi:NitT/TauT family transport system permease protein